MRRPQSSILQRHFCFFTHKLCWGMQILCAKAPSNIQQKSRLKTFRSLHIPLLQLSACSKHGNKAKKGDSQGFFFRALQIKANSILQRSFAPSQVKDLCVYTYHGYVMQKAIRTDQMKQENPLCRLVTLQIINN